MQNEKLTLATLGQLDDGTVGAVVNAAITDALKDCDDRPGLKKARKITLEVSFEPVVDERSFVLKGVDIDTKVKLTVPAQELREQYLRTSLNTATTQLEAFLANEFQEGLGFDDAEKN